MKKLLLPISLFSILLSACSCGENQNNPNENEDPNDDPIVEVPDEYKEVKVYLDPKRAMEEEISPYIYGTFIEHIESCIYNGLWSEIILDRKFYTPVGEDVSQWVISKGAVREETINPFEGEYSPYYKKVAK